MQVILSQGRRPGCFVVTTIILCAASVLTPRLNSQRLKGNSAVLALRPADTSTTVQVTYVFTRAQGNAVPKDRAAEFGRKMMEKIPESMGLATDVIDIAFDDPHLWNNCRHPLCEFVLLSVDRRETKIYASLSFKSRLPEQRSRPHPRKTAEEPFPLPTFLGKDVSESMLEEKALDMDLLSVVDDLIAHHKGNPQYHGVVQ